MRLKIVAVLLALLIPIITVGAASATTVRYESETGTIVDAVVESTHTGFSGAGYVNYNNVVGSYVEWTVTSAISGSADLKIRYANGSNVNRPMDIRVNGNVVAADAEFDGTGSWSTWETKTITTTLTTGVNTVRATATTAEGGPNSDYLDVTIQ